MPPEVSSWLVAHSVITPSPSASPSPTTPTTPVATTSNGSDDDDNDHDNDHGTSAASTADATSAEAAIITTSIDLTNPASTTFATLISSSDSDTATLDSASAAASTAAAASLDSTAATDSAASATAPASTIASSPTSLVLQTTSAPATTIESGLSASSLSTNTASTILDTAPSASGSRGALPSPSDFSLSGSSGPTPLPNAHPPSTLHRLSPGAIAAAVIIPLLVLAATIFGLLFCLRRRRKQQSLPFHPVTEVKEKLFHRGESKSGMHASPVAVNINGLPVRSLSSPYPRLPTSSANPASSQRPVVTSTTNPTYFTGLDTSETASVAPTSPLRGASTEDPPPPYRPRSLLPAAAAVAAPTPSVRSMTMGAVARHSSASSLSQLDGERPVSYLRITNGAASVTSIGTTSRGTPSVASRSPFDDPDPDTVSLEQGETGNDWRSELVSPISRPTTARTGSQRSITSTLYSSNASVREARPARLSVGGISMIQGAAMEEGSPFADPVDEVRR